MGQRRVHGVIDFELSIATHAVFDLSFFCCRVLRDTPHPQKLENKRAFLSSYLNSMGDPATDKDVDDLLVDVELGFIGHHTSMCNLKCVIRGSASSTTDDFKSIINECVQVTRKIREDEAARENVLKSGISCLVREKHEKAESEFRAPGRVFLVASDSPLRCIMEHAAKFRRSGELLPLTFSSHEDIAICESPKQELVTENRKVGHPVYRQFLVIGPANKALSVRFDRSFLRVASKVMDNDHRVVDVDDWNLVRGSALSIFDEGPSFAKPVDEMHCRGQRFQVNEDGTISPLGMQNLVLGASKVVWTTEETGGPG